MPDIQVEIEKLSPKPGDIIIFRYSRDFDDVVESVEQLSEIFPESSGVLFMLLPDSATVETLDEEEKEKLRRFLDEGVHTVPSGM